jgi:hypothetical protein
VSKHATSPEHRTVQTVVMFIGGVAVLLVLGTLYLVHEVISLDKITPASVAVLTSVSGLAGTAIGSLASMLVSTRPSPSAGDPTTFVADPASTVTVKPPDEVPPVTKATPAAQRRPRKRPGKAAAAKSQPRKAAHHPPTA